VHTDDLVNRAMDVRSASLKYIAVHIRHESQYFGIAGIYLPLNCRSLTSVGRVAMTIFTGDNACNSACTILKEAIAEFNASLSIFGHSVGIKTLEEVKGNRIESMISRLIWYRTPSRLCDNANRILFCSTTYERPIYYTISPKRTFHGATSATN